MKDHEHMSLSDEPFILLLICRGLRKSSFQIWQMVSKVHAVKFGQTLIFQHSRTYSDFTWNPWSDVNFSSSHSEAAIRERAYSNGVILKHAAGC